MPMRFVVLISLVVLCGCSIDEEPPRKSWGQNRMKQSAQVQVAPSDPIDALVAQLSKAGGIWVNGITPVLDFPETTPTAEIVAAYFQKVSFSEGEITSQTLQEVRQVRIADSLPNEQYTAALVETNLGRKILLMQYSQHSGWWCRVFDA